MHREQKTFYESLNHAIKYIITLSGDIQVNAFEIIFREFVCKV